MKNVVLIYELIPEDTKIYLLSDLDAKTYGRIVSCCGKYANTSGLSKRDDENLAWLSDYLEKHGESEETTRPILIEGYHAVVHTGFIL